MKKIKYLLALFISATIISCGNQQSENNADETKLSGSISIDGSSTVYPISEAIAEEFRFIQPDVKVTVGLSGTGGGFKKFSRGEIDINDASRNIKPIEDSLCAASGISYLELEVAYDGIVIVANPENDWLNDITVDELKKIWEPEAQNKIMKWNQIRPEWPDEELHLFGAGVESGTYDYFTEAIVGKSHESRGDYTASEDDNVLVQGIAGDKLALGFFGYAYYEENKSKLKLIGVNGGNGVVLPSIETVKDNSYSPLSRPLFIYVNSKAIERLEVQKFLEFYLTTIGNLATEVGFIPLSKEDYEIQLNKLKEFQATVSQNNTSNEAHQ